MKLKTKIMAVSVALLTVAVTVCCVFLLRFAYINVMDEVTDAGIRDYESFSTKYTAGISAANGKTGRVLASYLNYQLGQTEGGREYTLQREDEMVSNAIGLNALATVTKNGSTQYMYKYSELTVRYAVARYEGQTYFIVAGALPNQLAGYTLSLVRNITSRSDALSRLALDCVLTCVIVALLTAALLLAVLNFFLKPIGRLKAGASELARGHYQNRVVCSGKDELSELAEDFNSMADAIQASMSELQKKSEQQQEFIYDLSHELKTPVTSILLSSETLLGRVGSQSGARAFAGADLQSGKMAGKAVPKVDDAYFAPGRNPHAAGKRYGFAAGCAGNDRRLAPKARGRAGYRLRDGLSGDGLRPDALGACQSGREREKRLRAGSADCTFRIRRLFRSERQRNGHSAGGSCPA